MYSTPQTTRFILGAGERRSFDVAGAYLEIMICTALSVAVGFDGDTPQRFYPLRSYPGPKDSRFKRVTFFDELGAGCTVEFVVSDQPLIGEGVATLAAIQAILTSIDGDTDNLALILTALAALGNLQPFTALTEVPQTAAIAQTGVGELHIIDAAAGTRHIEIIADSGNTGRLFLSTATGVTAANSFTHIDPGGSFNRDWPGDIFICSENGTETARASIWS